MNSADSLKVRLKAGLQPVKPLAPERNYTVVFCVLLLLPPAALLLLGARGGIHEREGLGYLPLILLAALAWPWGRALARAMVPGSNAPRGALLATVALGLLAAGAGFSTQPENYAGFGPHERSCYGFGVKVAIPVVLVATWLAARGYAVRRWESALLLGLLSGGGRVRSAGNRMPAHGFLARGAVPPWGDGEPGSRHAAARVATRPRAPVLTLHASGAAFGKGTHLVDRGHRGVTREGGQERAVRPAQFQSLFRLFARQQPIKQT